MSEKNNRPLHIAMYPWFGISHITSNLHLANKLAKRGHKVTLFLPPNVQPKLASHNYHPTLISLIPISIPPVDGLPPGAETPNDVPASGRPLLRTAMDLTRDTIRNHLTCLKSDFILFDFAYWLPGVARELGIKSIYYNIGFLVTLASAIPKVRDLPPRDHFPSQGSRLQASQVKQLLATLERVMRGLDECDAIGSKTGREIEGPFCDFVENHCGKPLLLTGPLLPEPLAATLDPQFDGWLKGFGKESVVYCALGSECVLQKDQFQEMILGLELTGRPFIAALKPPVGYETIESALPEGFAERIKGRGIIQGGWVQQQLILKHPSVGCFVTHCGSGSISEAMVSKCQLVMIPQAADQFINAKLLSSELRVGVEVEKREEDGFVTKEAICEAVSIAMEEESEVGREVRANHTKLRNSLLDPGLEESYISSFIQKLYDMLE